MLTAIRADSGLRGTQVIILSGKHDQRDIDAGLLAGADFYVTKPFSPPISWRVSRRRSSTR